LTGWSSINLVGALSVLPLPVREKTMHLVVDRQGMIRGLYDEAVDLAALGEIHLSRASQVEPDANGD
jgi:hypothetical protein